MYKRPSNLSIEEEPNYRIKVRTPETVFWLSIRDRRSWKRLTAITHASGYAARNPTHTVHVHMDEV